jgi:hypothetical protein
VLYRIERTHLALLDGFETGYERVEVEVCTAAGGAHRASTYRSDCITRDPILFDWYRGLILEGAREHGLPEDYLSVLEALPTRPDGQAKE